jgi:hypothetical protein
MYGRVPERRISRSGGPTAARSPPPCTRLQSGVLCPTLEGQEARVVANTPPNRPEYARIQERIARAVERVLDHGHGSVFVEIDTFTSGRKRARIVVAKSQVEHV